MSDVFVSYARQDAPAERALVEALRGAGIGVLDEREVAAADDLADAISGRIEEAACVLVLWSRAAARSPWVAKEVELAVRAWANGRLVLATLDDAELPTGLRDLEAVQIAPDSGLGLPELVARVRATLGPGPQAPAAPRAAAPGPPPDLARSPARARKTTWWLIAGAVAVAFAAGVLLFMLARAPDAFTVEPGEGGPAIGWPEGLVAVLAIAAVLAAVAWVRRSVARRRAAPRATAPETSDRDTPGALDHPALFVSYSHQDGDEVNRVVRKIEQAGFSVWIDRSPGAVGGRYARAIVQAIRTSRAVALFCSRHAFRSDHVVREVYVAGDFRKPFIALQLDASELPDEFLYFLSGYPRIAVAELTPERLRSEISRCVTPSRDPAG